jgi:hypothetical protein
MTSQPTIALVANVYMNNVEQREPTVKAVAADPLCVTLLELVLEFRRSELALCVTVSNLIFSFAASRRHYTLRYPPLRACITRYVAFLWAYYSSAQ